MQHARIITYLLPDGCTIEWKNENQWVLKDGNLVYNFKKHMWVYEPMPSSRSHDHIAETRIRTAETAYDVWSRLEGC